MRNSKHPTPLCNLGYKSACFFFFFVETWFFVWDSAEEPRGRRLRDGIRVLAPEPLPKLPNSLSPPPKNKTSKKDGVLFRRDLSEQKTQPENPHPSPPNTRNE